MMKNILFILSLVLIHACATSQGHYSTTNKKAIKLFEEGKLAPSKSIDYTTNGPNYREGIKLFNQALEKDPNFWEAHLFAGEFHEYLNELEPAIEHYKKALQINPHHSPSGITYFYLANLQNAVGDYEGSIKNLDIFIQNRNANPDMVSQAQTLRNKSFFALDAIKNPQSFTPINLGPGVNTKDPEYFPTITVDGKTLLFTRRIHDDRVPHVKMQEDFYVSKLSKENIWQTAISMPSNVNTVLNEGAPTISPDGRSLIFVACSDQSGNNDYGEGRFGRGSCDLFFTKKLGSKWVDPINLPGNVNSWSWESQPSISSDGKTLYFIRRVSKRDEPVDSDIFVSRLGADGSWGTPEKLPPYINTISQEESVYIHPDGKTLYFASRGHVGMGGSDLFVTSLDENGIWSKPKNLGYPINTKYDENSLLVGPEGDIAFFASNREGGYGDLDIYYFELPEDLRPTKTLYFEGLVYDATSKFPIPGEFQLIDLKSGKEVVYSQADKVTGEFIVSLPLNREYALNVSYPGYTFFSQNFNMTNPEGLEAIHMDVPMIPITSDIPVTLKNVFFDLSKASLRPESFIELNKLVEFLNNYPTIKIEIAGHTDTRGDARDNLKLSNDRAKAVLDYLVTKGINADRLTSKGYGETMPKISDVEIEKLSTEEEREAAHQENRRTEYKILK